MQKAYLFILFLLLIMSCSKNTLETIEDNAIALSFYSGADLSYVNEMEDCGAIFKNLNNAVEDPYKIFYDAGAKIIRVRLWHNPKWTNYSNLEDVKKSISRAKTLGMKILLDFHYSDTWADPGKQIIPKEWEDLLNDQNALGQKVYTYTKSVLNELISENLKPDIVQIGNEINTMILQEENNHKKMDWDRNAFLINSGISAVRDLEKGIEVMLHIAQPENASWWFNEASANGITDFDWIGLSYYPKWSTINIDEIDLEVKSLIEKFNKRLMVVETAYPFTLEWKDDASNILGEDSLISNFPASVDGQYNYLQYLKSKLISGGAEGLIYWEPAWVSTGCKTLWGTGSHWENATLFNFENTANKGILFLN